MRYSIIALLFSLTSQFLICQTVADFENFTMPTDTFLNGKNANGKFESGDVSLTNDYNAMFDAWTGFAISSETNNLTGGFSNQYASIAGSGTEGSQNYAVAYAFDPVIVHISESSVLESCWITNNTFAFYSMRDGDQFSKKFGGANGDDADFFKITIRSFSNGILNPESLEIFLADFRFADNSLDYILEEWTEVDLSSLGVVDSLQISLSSSDVGGFGMNTPAYFCIDNIITERQATSNSNTLLEHIGLFPNPVRETLYLTGLISFSNLIRIMDARGRIVLVSKDSDRVNVEAMEPGMYFLQLDVSEGRRTLPFVKLKE